MTRRLVPIKVKSRDLQTIGQLIKCGVHQARVFMRALALRQLGQGITAPQIAASLPLTPKAIREIAHRYHSNGLEAALYDRQRPGAKAGSRRLPKATYCCHGLLEAS
jgi:putative transposase